MSDNKVNSNYTLDKDTEKNADSYLTDKEKKLLKNLNQTANTLKDKKDKIDIFDQSLNSILKEWSSVMSKIFHELSTMIYVNKYIKISDNIYEFTTYISKDIWKILTKENRLIYVGVTLIFISFVIYFIHISN